MYIGLKQRKEKEVPGSYEEKIIAFDNRYINGKIDYLTGREPLASSYTDKLKVKQKSELAKVDFQ